MKEMTSTKLYSSTNSTDFIHKFPSNELSRNQIHREMITQIAYFPRRDEYISLSSDSIRFWATRTMNPTRFISEPGNFSCMIVINQQNVLAVTTTTRKLLFFELDSLRLLPATVGASPTADEIKSMSGPKATNILNTMKTSDLPMFNVPTCMCMYFTYGGETDTDSKIEFLIADDQGYVEAYLLKAPKVRQGSDFQITKTAKIRIHQEAITNIEYIDTIMCYATSSLDHTVKLWKYDTTTHKFTTEGILKDNQPILGFYYCKLQKVLITYGISRDAYVWSLLTQRKTFKLGGHYNQVIGICSFLTNSDVDYIVTMTNRKEFKLWDSVNFRMVREWTDPTLQHPDNRFSALYFDSVRRCLLAASSSLSKWAEDVSQQTDSTQSNTHAHQIIGAHFSDTFDQVVTCDAHGDFSVWNINTGSRDSLHHESCDDDVVASTLDWKGRRLFTLTKKNVINVWNFNSAAIMISLDILKGSNLVSVFAAMSIGTRNVLACGGWDKVLSLYIQTGPESLDLFRSYLGHKSDISSVVSFNYGFISGDANGEIFTWTLDTSKYLAKAKLPNGAQVECLYSTTKYVFVGDNLGFIHVYSVPKLSYVLGRSAHDTVVKSSITDIKSFGKLMYTADTLGYVREWIINEEGQFEMIPGKIERCARDEIRQIEIVSQGKFIITIALDMCALLWRSGDFEYVGLFDGNHFWNLQDEKTWKKDKPFLPDEKHFAREKTSTLLGEKRSSRNSVAMSLRSARLSNNSNHMILSSQKQVSVFDQNNFIKETAEEGIKPPAKTSQTKHEERPKTVVDPELFGKTLTEYFNGNDGHDEIVEISKNYMPEMAPNNRNNFFEKPRELQMTSRPNDLVMRVTTLMKPSTAFSRASSRLPARPCLKIPPPRKSTATRNYRLPVSLTL
ncbi:hypothetical protein TVAG_191080 [Trichomonas vaginalis G3]|uniref:Uncharacterized protein n=1 Tax=Trichomonas vaginalis (strain ATCC PRA-98 / G3) TaxID=412133 RepID=A2EFJ1_TRIV3|nr:WD40 repeat-containing protein [Trichomonas vaginalis G3]EAY08585.1 hypothetical protein TVAG_191080 [Trichomonas vaginalis G3]KAI5497886.1 WD40 repeat-containing protein [Trichomonas vaginalis G3]|eukprot:XP_001320808.1 hypothetical protein [Trichomonas vaginalis G3]